MRNIYILFFMLITVSCEKVIDMNIPDNGRRPVVNCVFGDSDFVYLTIHKSKHILDNTYDFSTISGAHVVITEVNTNLSDTLYETSTPGRYESSQLFSLPGSYNLNVVAEGIAVSSGTLIPAKTQIISVDTSTYTYDNEVTFRMDVRFPDPGPEKNYFMIGLRREAEFGEKYNVSIFSSDLSVTAYYRDYLIFNDDLFSNKDKTLRVEIQKNNLYTQDDSLDLTVQLFSLSYDAYMYFVTSQEQMNSGGPFSEPVVVYNNIKEGYGIFAGYSVNYKTVRVPKYEAAWIE